ncbi:MAG: sulfur carrier protein ThiS [Deltaproteobacteria bacterium]|nr:sulfur carrier protein ThiS [Deltaproteobacteria bacterium]
MMLTVNGEQKQFQPSPRTVADLLELLTVPGRRTAVEQNGLIVDPNSFTTAGLQENDKLEIVTFVGGG